MRVISLILALAGLIILFFLLFLPPTKITSQLELNQTIENQRVFTSGQVIKEGSWGKSFLLTLDNKIEIISPKSGYLNKNVSILGKSDFFNKMRVLAQTITIK